MKPDKRPLVVSGPSGCGKSTLLKKLFAEFPNTFGFSVSHTTRKPRTGETPGKDYHYISKPEFEQLISTHAFIEHATFGGNIYGTSFKAVDDVTKQGQICVLDIERQGVESVKKTDMDAHFVFVKPPSNEVLVERLRGRGTETEESIAKRMESVIRDAEYADRPGSYDIIIVNDQLEEAYGRLKDFIMEKYPFLKK